MANVARGCFSWPRAVALSCLVACAPPQTARRSPVKIAAQRSPDRVEAPARAAAPPIESARVDPSPTAAASTAEEDAAPAEPVTIDVASDKHVFVVFGARTTNRVFVYFHGKCGDPLAFRSFERITRPFGTFVSFVGDVKCDGGRMKWGDDTGLLDARVTSALDAVETARGTALDKAHLVAIGYSAGALRAEALATKFPDRYQRVILIGGPRAPRATSLTKTEAILIMAGQLDIWMPLAEAASDLKKSGRPARFIEIPGARHGDYGPKAEETMTEAFRWVIEEHG